MSDERVDAIAAALAHDDGYWWANIAPYPKGEQYRQKALRILTAIAPLMAEAELRAAGERVIAAFTSGTLRDDQRRALIAMGDALMSEWPVNPTSILCQHCGRPSGISSGTLEANGAAAVTCAACAQQRRPVDP